MRPTRRPNPPVVLRSFVALAAALGVLVIGPLGVPEALAQSAAKPSAEHASSPRRIVSWMLMGTGAAGIAAGITFGALSVIEYRTARDISRGSGGDDLTDAEQREYDAALAARDDFRVVSGASAGAGLGLFLLGGALFVLDSPPVSRQAGPKSSAFMPASASDASVSALPHVGPAFTGATITVRF